MTERPMIEAAGLHKRYGRTVALESLDLRVERGEVFGLLGPNGAGKTTTVKLLLGLTRPTAGEGRLPLPRVRVTILHRAHLSSGSRTGAWCCPSRRGTRERS